MIASDPPISREIALEVGISKKFLLLYGQVDYVDAFGHPRWTTFCMTFGARDLTMQGHYFAMWHEGNNAS
jgi:hypothetical protein